VVSSVDDTRPALSGAPARRAPLGALPRLLHDDPALLGVLGRRQATLAVPEPARSLTIAAISELTTRRPLVVAVPTTGDAERLVSDLGTYLGTDRVDLFPAWETLPFERVSPSTETMGRRMRTMWRLRDPERAPDVVVAPARALVQRLGPHVEDVEPLVVAPGSVLDLHETVERLVASGYRREYQVEHRGEVAVRGSIIDVFPSIADAPVRIDLWGDEVDRLAEFSVADQRTTVDLESVEIFPCRELLPTDEVRERAEALMASQPWGREQWSRLADGETFDGMESWLPWLTDGTHVLFDLVDEAAQVVLVEPRRMRDRAADIAAEEADLARTLASSWGVADGADLPELHVDFDRLLTHTDAPVWTMTIAPEGPDVETVAAAAWFQAGADGSKLVGQLGEMGATGYRIVVAADGTGSAERIDKLLRDHGVSYTVSNDGVDLSRAGGVIVGGAPIERGVILPSVKLAVLAEADLTGRRRSHRPARPRRRAAQGAFDDLEVGSYVVHHHHGVARYAGMVKRTIGGVERDYLLLEYRGDDRLYVPSEQIDAVRMYTGGDAPRLSKMGGTEFARTKAAARAEINQIAQELVVLYQKRQHTPGHAFAIDTPWQRELEESFQYQETPDQLTAIADVKADMEADRPMDRLVIGDVGFGKTEVAIRAAFKAVQDGRQAAVLVPTTLLAQQHHATFSERYAGYPIRVEVMSRFLTGAQARAIAADVAEGKVDVLIGTHRILSDDVRFKRLGLLVIDEEQRFGVGAKEAIKHLRTDVDVLTLTATPIPRTLEMSLTGIRDLSLLNTPPAERQPILTYVGEYDERAVAESIRRELLREGQVFFVHNRVADIEEIAAGVRDLVPEARVAVAHGQMDEGSLEQVVVDFWEGRFDVLVCTTIIESGIDMPTVNTLVVDRADLLGLGQLHQLRGRVGRAGQRAYAYLFFPADRVLTEEAYERLRTIGESTELGSGFRIAMRDLEIRGAGNLLGTGQTGHLAAVGYDLYCQMVNEAIAELNGTPVREPAEIKIELPLDANLPSDYVSREDLRLDAYRRLAEVGTIDDVDDIAAEWVDRYGPVPDAAAALLDVARVRVACVRTGVTELLATKSTSIGGKPWVARLSPLDLPMSKRMRLERTHKGAVVKTDLHEVQLPVPGGRAMVEALLAFLDEFVPAPTDPDGDSPSLVASP
jgi:transcription-repair coupling factor (superfamily II helicase)